MRDSPDIYLFRHGLAKNNVDTQTIYGQSDNVPLVNKGVSQAQILGHALHEKGLIPDVVYSSPALRAQQTARTALSSMGLRLDIVQDSRLNEQHTGDWTGQPAKQIFTDEMVKNIAAEGKSFRAPNGESMDDVGLRMFDWVETLLSDQVTRAHTVFGFAHGGSIRSLASYICGWDHARTYSTQPGNASLTNLQKVDGIWRVRALGVNSVDIESRVTTATEINSRLAGNETVKKHLESVVWFGSVRNDQDIHSKSDCDIQVVLDEPKHELTLELNSILKDYPEVDLSIMYMKDIFDLNGEIIFHDGTKGPFFMFVLAAGKILYGRNIYAEITERMSLDDCKPSLMITIREYLSRLRVMAAQSPDETLSFKKYSLKLFKDLLAYDGAIPMNEISKIDNAKSYNEILKIRHFSDTSLKALSKVIDYEHDFTAIDMASLLQEYEEMVDGVLNETS